jgi:hypothetical protein
MIIKSEHYLLVEDVVQYKKCDGCGRKLRTDNTDHVCNAKRETYKNNKLNKKRDYIPIKPIKEKEIQDVSKIVFFDLETFPDSVNRMHVVI